MNILAVDTAGKTAAVAVLRDDVLLYEAQCNNGLTHSETLLPMIDTALKAAGLTVDDLDVLGVTNGPGSFTGLRIGLAVVKGLALPRQIPCAGVSTMAALAYGLAGEGTVIGAQDARRGQVYWGAFDLAAHDRLTPDTAAPITTLENFVQTCKKPLFLLATAQLCATIHIRMFRAWSACRSRCRFCAVRAWHWPPGPCGSAASVCRLPPCCLTTTV